MFSDEDEKRFIEAAFDPQLVVIRRTLDGQRLYEIDKQLILAGVFVHFDYPCTLPGSTSRAEFNSYFIKFRHALLPKAYMAKPLKANPSTCHAWIISHHAA
jgi:hypothetical protein